MEKFTEQISIGLLQKDECQAANEIWLNNYLNPNWICMFAWRVFKSWRFLVACALTHVLIFLMLSVRMDIRHQLVTLVTSVVIQMLYVLLVFQVRHHPWDCLHLYSHWSKPHRRFIVARDESRGRRVVGTVAIQRHAKDPSVTELFRFRVLPEYRRRGIGAMLNKEAERLAKEDFGCRTMVLDTVAEHVTGVAFYVRNGYKLTKSVVFCNPYRDPNIKIVVYGKELPTVQEDTLVNDS